MFFVLFCTSFVFAKYFSFVAIKPNLIGTNNKQIYLNRDFIDVPLKDWPVSILAYSSDGKKIDVDLNASIGQFPNNTKTKILFETYAHGEKLNEIPINKLPYEVFFYDPDNFNRFRVDKKKSIKELALIKPGLSVYEGSMRLLPDSRKLETEQSAVFVVSGWTSKSIAEEEVSSLNRNLEEKLKSDSLPVDLTNNYVIDDHSPVPEFNAEDMANKILEAFDSTKKNLCLVAYSEGCIGMMDAILRVFDAIKADNDIYNFISRTKVYFIDPPATDFFSKQPGFWFVSSVASFVQWIAGIGPGRSWSDRSFPLLSDAFLWCFRQFWRFFLVPLSEFSFSKHAIRLGHKDKFYRAVFAKNRANKLEEWIKKIDPADQMNYLKFVTFYLQDWRDENLFSKIGNVIKVPNANHSKIAKVAISKIADEVNSL